MEDWKVLFLNPSKPRPERRKAASKVETHYYRTDVYNLFFFGPSGVWNTEGGGDKFIILRIKLQHKDTRYMDFVVRITLLDI